MNEKKIKVTDKRLFTPDGELKEEYRDLETGVVGPEPTVESKAPTEPPSAASMPTMEHQESGPAPEATAPPSFFDLVAAVAQPIALYLGDVTMPDGESMENIPLARLHIDLLEILQEKSTGNLTDQEKGFLEDLLYQLRLRYVEKTRQDSEN